MEVFAYLLALVWSILCLILFFKIWGMTNNVEQLTREVHELKMVLVQEQTKAKVVVSKEQEEISLVQSPSDLDREDLKVGDIVELKSNGTHYKVIGIDDLGFVQCEPIKKSIFDSFKAFKRGEIKRCKTYFTQPLHVRQSFLLAAMRIGSLAVRMAAFSCAWVWRSGRCVGYMGRV